MAEQSTSVNDSGKLSKELGLFGVIAIATGTTLSAGLFLLPGLAAQQAGPAVIICYLLAAIPLIPAMLSIVELATAMPRAGGAYYFLDRSLGPLAGTIGGLGTWLALVLKTAFALVGMGAYLILFFPNAEPWMLKVVAVLFALFFGAVNLFGSKKMERMQIFLVVGLLLILSWFMLRGSVSIDFARFKNFFGAGSQSIMATAGMVYISYVGVTKVASVSEEIKNPEKNLPIGVFVSLGIALVIYTVCTIVMVGVLQPDTFYGHLTAPAETARVIGGKFGELVITIAALFAFSSVANAGIMASSRYPLAMGRDHLLPTFFRKLSKRGTPKTSIYVTVGVILVILLVLDPIKIAKLASAFQLLMFALLCLAVIVMRESHIESYDPGFKSPLYPWMQIFGIISPFFLIAEMGWLPIVFSSSMIALGIGWYYYYARKRVERHGAIYHVFERLGRRRFDALDTELRSILKEKGLRAKDPFDEIIAGSAVIDLDMPHSFDHVVRIASDRLAEVLPCSSDHLYHGFMEGTRTGATPVSGGVALPHMRIRDIPTPYAAIVRSKPGLLIPTGDVFGETHTETNTHAIFFLVSPDADPGQHLRLLAQLASRVDQSNFMNDWLSATDASGLKRLLLRSERVLTIIPLRGTSTGAWVDQHIRDMIMPEGSLVAVIHRGGETIIPRGSTKIVEGDQITVIGNEIAIAELYQQYGDGFADNTER